MKVITFEKMQEILETLIDRLNTINDKFASKDSLKITDDKLKTLSDSYNAHGPHIDLSFDLPKPAENEAQAGASDNAARADHVHPLQTSVQNAETAAKLTKSIDVTIGSKKESFDGSNNISWTLDEIGAAKKEHTHDFSSSDHNHDDTYEKIGHVHSYNDLTDLPDLSDIGGGLDITDTIILKSYESGKTFELNVTPTGNLITKESSEAEYSEVILRDGDNNKFKLIINDNGVLLLESTTYENKFKDTYIQAQYPYAEIFRISVFTDNDGSVLTTSSLNQGLINNDGVYNNYTWSSIKILEEINKAKESISQPDNSSDKQQLNELYKTTTALSNILGNTELQTEEKTVTAAINEMQTELDSMLQRLNELFQSANNGKELIANAIGEPLSKDDTFSAMSADIDNLVSSFKSSLINAGVTVNNNDKFKQLIDKVNTLADNGLKMNCVSTLPATGVENQLYVITDTASDTYTMSTESSDIFVGDNVIRFLITDNTEFPITSFPLGTNTLNCRIDSSYQNNKSVTSWLYKNNSWNRVSYGSKFIMKNKIYEAGYSKFNSTLITYSTSTGLTIGGDDEEERDMMLYSPITQTVDFSLVYAVRIKGNYRKNSTYIYSYIGAGALKEVSHGSYRGGSYSADYLIEEGTAYAASQKTYKSYGPDTDSFDIILPITCSRTAYLGIFGIEMESLIITDIQLILK
jgi:hypothetical protein